MSCGTSLRIGPKHSICLDFILGGKKRRADGGREETQGLLNDDAPPELSKNESYTFLYFSFFLCGVGMYMCWSAFTALIATWISIFGNDVWADLLVAYNLPGLPILILQLVTDSRVEARFNKARVWQVRVGFSLACLTVLGVLLPFLTNPAYLSRSLLTAYVLTIGLFVGLAHGWIYSLAALYPPKCTAYILVGAGFATLVLLAVSFITKNATVNGGIWTYMAVGTVSSVLALIFVVSMIGSKASGKIFAQHVVHNAQLDDNTMRKVTEHEAAFSFSTAKKVYPSVISVFLTILSVVAGTALIPSIPSAQFGSKMATIILFNTSIASFLGNELVVLVRFLGSQPKLLIFSVLRFLILPFLIIYSVVLLWHNDWFANVVLAVFALTGAYGLSESYTVASESVEKHQQSSASILVNIGLYLGVYLGLLVPYILPLILKLK